MLSRMTCLEMDRAGGGNLQAVIPHDRLFEQDVRMPIAACWLELRHE